MKNLFITAILTISTVQSVNATGMYTCDSGNRAGWQSMSALQEKLEQEGWKVRKIKEDGGCYEVYATNPQGQRGEAYFHPETFELELLARRGKILFEKSDQ